MEMTQIILAFSFGLVFIVSLMVLAIRFPHPTPFQYTVFRIVLSLAAAGIAAMIPGFINVELTSSELLAVRAGGAIAVFVVVFFFNPAQLAGKSEKSTGSDGAPNLVGANIWQRLTPNLQDAFVLAATAAQRQGKDRVSTRGLFAAFTRLQPGELSKFFAELPAGALPEPVNEGVLPDKSAINSVHEVSACVSDSLQFLGSRSTQDSSITPEEMFVDIARNGRGESVKRLRAHGVDKEQINQIVSQLGWTVTERPV